MKHDNVKTQKHKMRKIEVQKVHLQSELEIKVDQEETDLTRQMSC